jgi:CubicO group peptidase (beta-lactamase class C family)
VARAATASESRTEPTPPRSPTAADWPTATPEEEGLDSKDLSDLLESIQAQGDPIDSVLIVRDGRLVLDAYFYPFRDVDRPVLDFFPGRTVAHLEDRKRAMRLKHLLTMSAGLDWEEDISFQRHENSATRMSQSPDPVQFVLDTPMSVGPGTRFNYNSGGSHLLSAILQTTTGGSALDFAHSRLFEPLGISEVTWAADAQGVSHGGTGLRMKPRDLAKLGELYRNGGVWADRRIVPEAWVRDAVKPQIASAGDNFRYGYQWWLPASGGYAARGFGGQLLWVLPELRMIVVMTGGSQDGWLPGTLTELFILPAVKGVGPLPENPAARGGDPGGGGASTSARAAAAGDGPRDQRQDLLDGKEPLRPYIVLVELPGD